MSDEQENTEVEETEEGAESTEDEGAEEQGEWSPPGKDDWEKLTRAAKARRKERDDARRELAALKAKESESEQENAKPDEAAKWRETAARASAATSLQAAGFSGTAKQARRLTRLLDLANIEPDDTGDFDFEDEIEDLRQEFPMLFQRDKPVTSSRKPTTADRGGSAGAPGRDRTTERLLRAAGYR